MEKKKHLLLLQFLWGIPLSLLYFFFFSPFCVSEALLTADP